MPNLKIYVDDLVYEERKDALRALLPILRETVCKELSVPPSACTLAVLPVMGLPDQAQANLEIHYMPKPDRTKERMTEACTVFSALLEGTIGSVPTVRAMVLDAETYIALK